MKDEKIGCHLRRFVEQRRAASSEDDPEESHALPLSFSSPLPPTEGWPVPHVEERPGQPPRYHLVFDGDLVIRAGNIALLGSGHVVFLSGREQDPDHPEKVNKSIWLNPNGELAENFVPKKTKSYTPFSERKKGLFGARHHRRGHGGCKGGCGH